MSGHVYKLYRTLSENQVSGLNVMLTTATGYYDCDGEQKDLDLQNTGDTASNSYTIENTDEWDPQVHGGCICQKLIINNQGLRNLFKGAEKLAMNDATLGIAALWHISNSYINGCQQLPLLINPTSIDNGTTTEVEFIFPFEEGSLSGNLNVRYELFLKEVSMSEEDGVASIAGTRLGEICSPLSIYIDGNDSTFPIVNVELKDGPLWWVNTRELEDPTTDPLSEDYISIVFNKSHKDYERLMQGKAFVTPLFYEVLASAMEEIFTTVYITDFKEEMQSGEFAEGTVAAALEYIKSVYGIRVDGTDDIHTTVRAMIDKMRNGAASTK